MRGEEYREVEGGREKEVKTMETGVLQGRCGAGDQRKGDENISAIISENETRSINILK